MRGGCAADALGAGARAPGVFCIPSGRVGMGAGACGRAVGRRHSALPPAAAQKTLRLAPHPALGWGEPAAGELSQGKRGTVGASESV